MLKDSSIFFQGKLTYPFPVFPLCISYVSTIR